MPMLSSACFQSVGQGGFYTTSIGHREDGLKRQFHLVYDCGTSGSRSQLKELCRSYLAAGDVRRIDALVISHFHADHVNGLDFLMSAKMPTRQVFLPYLSPVERLLCALRNQGESKKYYAFLADPVGFLTARGVQQVIFVSGSSEPLGEDDQGHATDEPRKPSRGIPRIDLSGADRDPAAEAVYDADYTKSDHTPIFVTDRKPVFLSGLWKFRFFTERGHSVDLGSPAKIAALMAEDPASDDERKFQKFLRKLEKTLGGLSARTITAAIASKRKRKLLRKSYDLIQVAHNEVSLVLWHGPVVYGNGQEATTSARGFWARFPNRRFGLMTPETHKVGGGGGTMLTGDLSLLGNAQDKFRRHFCGELDDTSLFDLPHHGSAYSWDNAIAFERQTIFVVSAGLSNSHGHPNPGLLALLERKYDGRTLWSHERAPVYVSVEVVDVGI